MPRQFTEAELEAYHALSSHHREKLTADVACFHCQYFFKANQVAHWCDDNQTATCPQCYVDSIIPLDEVDKDDRLPLIEQMRKRWFVDSATRVTARVKP